MAESRVKNSITNIYSGLLFRVISLLINFFSRTVFIRILGDGCLGLNGLFTSVLSMFSLAELGIGQAITFYMYKPIANNDEKRLSSLIGFYKICYRIIGLAILIIGLALIPVLPKLVNMDIETGYNLVFIYILYLVNTAITYLFFSYPQTVLTANQKQYIVSRNDACFVVISAAMEILTLFLTHNYIVYLLVRIIVAVVKNIVLAIISVRLYPYINSKKAEKISFNEIKEMFKDVYAIFVVKLSSQLFNSTDNIFISAMFGTILAGYNSNYLMIINAVYGIISTLIYSFGASVGNLYATETKKRTEEVFSILDFINFWISGICTVCLFQLLNPFIQLFWGKRLLFSMTSVALMCATFYVVSSLYALFSFRQSMGLFRYCIYNQLIAAIINIFLDFLLGKLIGINGLFLSTLLANVFIAVFPYAKNLYLVGFEMKVYPYVLRILRGYGLALISCVVTFLLCRKIPITIGGFLVMLLISCLIPNLIFSIALWRSNEFKEALQYLKQFLQRKVGKKVN